MSATNASALAASSELLSGVFLVINLFIFLNTILCACLNFVNHFLEALKLKSSKPIPF